LIGIQKILLMNEFIKINSNNINGYNISVVAIQNYGPSGSLFLQSLLDYHPNILSIPALYIRDYFEFWDNLNDNNKKNNVISSFIGKHSYWFDSSLASAHGWGLDQMGDSMNEKIFISEKIFRNKLEDFFLNVSIIDRKQFFIAVYLAYAHAIKKDFKYPVIISFPIHSLPKHYAQHLVDDFKDVQFVYTIRESVQCIGSLINHVIKYKAPLNPVECAFSQILDNYCQHVGKSFYVYGDRPYFNNYTNQSKAVKLEDLHTKPKVTMFKLVKWLEIEWDDCLLKSTFDGKKWWNRPESKRLSGFGNRIIKQKYKTIINKFDRIRLHALLYKKHVIWNYKTHWFAEYLTMRFLIFFSLVLPFKSEFKVIPSRINFTIIRPLIKLFRNRYSQLKNRIKHILLYQFKLSFLLQLKNFFRRNSQIFLFSYILTLYIITKRCFMIILILLSTVFIIPLALILLMRDYLVIRWWLYKGWFVNRIEINSIVKPITV